MPTKTKREEKIKENINLVHACARRFMGRGIDYDDLFQIGCVGLIKSVDGFDETRGFAFSTYAVPVIIGEIKSAFRASGAVKLSRSMKEKGIRALREREAFICAFGREPAVSELAERLGISSEETAEILACNLPVLSLTTEEGGEFEIGVASPEEELSDSLALTQLLNKLPADEKELIELRYFKEYTQSATAKVFGISQVQVSRKEKKILQKLRSML